MESGNTTDAIKMAYEAYSLDPLSADAWRAMIKLNVEYTDADTLITMMRELLHFSRRFYDEAFHQVGMFYSISSTRPYMRVLTDLAEIAMSNLQLDVATYCYEEMVRLNHRDNTGARDPLICCYLKIIGRARRFPKTTRPVRTIAHAKKLIRCVFTDENSSSRCPLFEEGNTCVRVAEMCFAYVEKGNWKKIARSEYQKNPLLFQLIFDEVRQEDIPEAQPNMQPGTFLAGNKSEDVRMKGGWIKEAMLDWPDLVIELYKLIRGKMVAAFEEKVKENAPIPEAEIDSKFKTRIIKLGGEFLQTGRDTLTKKDFHPAFDNCTMAKRSFVEAAQPSKRFYLHSPFAVSSNRATAGYFMGRWNCVRSDIRFTLKVKPDHEKSYMKLPKLANAFQAKQLYAEFDDISRKVDAKEINGEENWKALADRVIGLTSITALSHAAVNKLTPALREELIRTGIEDCYTPVNVDMVHPVLPWLKQTDLEKPIPNA